MAASPLNQKSNLHARSNSLPSRPHPLILKCNEHLDILRASSLLSNKLRALQDLIDCVENLVQLPLTRDALIHDCQENFADELLDGSLRLLDVCASAKDALLHTKECTRELQSIIRRRRGGEVGEVKKFLASRKVVKNAISKALTNLKGATSTNKDHQPSALVRLLQEVEMATLSTFETLLQFISGGTSAQAKSNSWLSISKLIQTKRVASSQVSDESEFAQVDVALQTLVLTKTSKIEEVNNLQNHLEKMESRIQDLEEGLEFVFRHLIKIRVSLLNILNH
ncbi:hypothetical protein RIF29_13063 [Crotalaria pallida]|uniref:Uncharacterized protein n=1 Tax=Crotalaria pallida TaxID=3830 RepID=A0AAN9P1L0_CROPI